MNKKIDKLTLFSAFVITTLIFISGIFAGHAFSNRKLTQVADLQDDLKMGLLDLEMQYGVLAEKPCSVYNSSLLTKDIYDLGSKLDHMENSLGVKNPTVISLKRYYSLLQVRHWLFLRKYGPECSNNTFLLLYFYSNEDDCSRCKQQGYVLTQIRKDYPNLNIYSLDINIDSQTINAFKDVYNIETMPTLILNDEMIEGFRDKRELEGIFESKGLNTT